MRDPVREQLAQARRAQILAAAVQLFATKGYHSTTIRDIAREAGIAEGTVYVYFENKSALLLGILDRMRESVTRDAPPARVDHADPRDFLRTYLRYPLAAPQADNFALFQVILSEIMVNEEMRTRYSQEVLAPNAATAEGALRQLAERHRFTALDVELTAHVLAAMVLGLIVARIAGDEVLLAHWDELPNLLADLFVSGWEEGG